MGGGVWWGHGPPPGSPTPRLKPPWGWVPGRQLHTVSLVGVHARLVSLPLPGGRGGLQDQPRPKPLPQARSSLKASGSSFPLPLDAASGLATWRERPMAAWLPAHPRPELPVATCQHVPTRLLPLGLRPWEEGEARGPPGGAPSVVWGLWLWLGGSRSLHRVQGLQGS